MFHRTEAARPCSTLEGPPRPVTQKVQQTCAPGCDLCAAKKFEHVWYGMVWYGMVT